jgi:hypothetical protein
MIVLAYGLLAAQVFRSIYDPDIFGALNAPIALAGRCKNPESAVRITHPGTVINE